MFKQINIELIDRIRKPKEGNRILNGVISILMFVLFPIIIIVGIIIMLTLEVFEFFQRFYSKPNIAIKSQSNEIIKPTQIDQWNLFTNLNQLKIYEKYIGEVRFGPAYLNLKSEPKINYLNGELFGDWFFLYSKGILLQQWNSIKNPNANLIFIGIENLEIKVLQKNIPSVIWDIVETKDRILELNCDTGKEILIYKIEIEKLTYIV
tara:strand:- start:88679 stop:89299 length:621 start_codon:yes stop_codon:yes gene_type:complete